MIHKILLIFFFNVSQCYCQWIVLNSGTSADLNSVYSASVSTVYAAGDNGVILKTTNSGTNWVALNAGLTENINSIFFYNSTRGAACANSGKIIFTTNSGSTWNTASSGVMDDLFSISFYPDGKGICSGSSGTLLYTTNGGQNWSIGSTGFLSSFYGAFMLSSSTGYACGVNTIFQPLVAKTTDGGATWDYSVFYLNTNEGNLRDINFISANEGFAVSHVFTGEGGISYTSDGGADWTTQLFPGFLDALDFATVNTGFAAGVNGFITRTTNKGSAWITQSTNVSNDLTGIDFIDSLNGYSVGEGGVILKTTNGGLTAISGVSNSTPAEFSLEQNFPNPFNPATNISYELRTRGYVNVKVYDVQGREIKTIVEGIKSEGTYSVTFNSSNLPGGIYFYTMYVNGSRVDSKKMLLIK